MKNRTGENTTFVEEKTTNQVANNGATCPKCGGRMVASAHQVATRYPAPALERQVCEENGCNYSRFVKLDTETGLTNSGVKAGEMK